MLKQELRVMVLLDEDLQEGMEEVEKELQESESNEVGEAMELSINSVVRLTSPQTMKVKGLIGKQEVVVLIDCGATNNFTSTELVQKLGLPRAETIGFRVIIRTRFAVQGAGIYKWVILSLQNLEITEDFLPLELGSSNVILSMKWLSSLGKMSLDWKSLTMCFHVGGTNVTQLTLQGDPSFSKSLVSLKSMMKAFEEGGEGILLELENLSIEVHAIRPEVRKELERVLIEFEGSFQEPNGLPPHRERDHSIILQAGTAPISIRPYR